MQFLKTLFWIALTVVLVLFAKANWNAVTLKLWGGLEADVKLPVLVLAAFLLGFLPTFIVYRARLWGLRRRLEPTAVSVAPPRPTPVPVAVDNGESGGEGERVATDSKVWPTA
jgi:lipopolysaccharide assembly protein A